MVKYNRALDATFQALADPTRRAIVAALSRGQASVTELARPHRMSLPAVMKHLRVLEKAGLLTQKKFGRTRRCRLAARPEDLSAMLGSDLRLGITDPDLADAASRCLDTLVSHGALDQPGVVGEQPGDADANQSNRDPIGLEDLAEAAAPE